MGLSFKNCRIIGVLMLAAGTLSACGMFRHHTPQECMERAMYFESNQSSREGMIAVGTVVMNRVNSGQYPDTVCEVVGQRNQFAPGVLTRKMNERSMPLVREAARSVLRGERHPMVQNAMFFHAANYRAGYNNMHYVLTAGGNAFYERRPVDQVTQPVPLAPASGMYYR